MHNFIKEKWTPSCSAFTGSVQLHPALKNLSCCMIMCLPTKLQMFANFPPPPPQYYLDLSPTDYILFPKLKMKLKGPHFADVAEIQDAVTDELKKVQKEEFSAGFHELYGCAKNCIYASGVYFELKKKRHVFEFKKNHPKNF